MKFVKTLSKSCYKIETIKPAMEKRYRGRELFKTLMDERP